jgi:2-dehydro-3-deoxyphosphooctonate aldolase (KDO 8-P synthase)
MPRTGKRSVWSGWARDGRGRPAARWSVLPDRRAVRAGDDELHLRIAERLASLSEELRLPVLFKASFDKANRSSPGSPRGPGIEAGLRALERVRAESGLPLLTDVHEAAQCGPGGEVVDVLQIPAFLCRQTDLLTAAGATGRPVNVKKGQWMAPEEMSGAVRKVAEAGSDRVAITERGTFLGYGNLVVDMRSFAPHPRGVRGAGDLRRHPLGPAPGHGRGPERGRARAHPRPGARCGGRGRGRALPGGAPGAGLRPFGRHQHAPARAARAAAARRCSRSATRPPWKGRRREPGELARIAREVRLVVLDVDGVMTDGGRLPRGDRRGREGRDEALRDPGRPRHPPHAARRHHPASSSPAASPRPSGCARPSWGSRNATRTGAARKLEIAREVLDRRGLGWESTACLADDLADLPVLRRVALPAAVRNAVPEVRAIARWVSRREGGSGAVRELIEALLRARGAWTRTVEGYLDERDDEA